MVIGWRRRGEQTQHGFDHVLAFVKPDQFKRLGKVIRIALRHDSALDEGRDLSRGNPPWRTQRTRWAKVFYTVLRTSDAGRAVACAGLLNNASDDCRLFMDAPAATRMTSYTDRPGPGTWTYRIGVSANWLDDFGYGDVYVVSKAVTVTVR